MALCNVQEKICCIFETTVINDMKSAKRPDQCYKVLASSEHLRSDAAADLTSPSCRATEKLDGTCCLIRSYNSRPWLWVRHDRKPTKAAEKRFRAYGRSGAGDSSFAWDVDADFKEVPSDWIAAGSGLPDAGGHIPGWLPVDPKSRSHCWHLAAVDLQDTGLALILRPTTTTSSVTAATELKLCIERLDDLIDCTMELVGTNVNANPYRIGTRSNPIHFLIRHGIIEVDGALPIPSELINWFETDAGQVEGIVWHCADSGRMFKLHRHHLELAWPVARPRLMSLPVTVNVKDDACSAASETVEFGGNKLLQRLYELSGRKFDSLADL